jgi:hypothetical protein
MRNDMLVNKIFKVKMKVGADCDLINKFLVHNLHFFLHDNLSAK